MEIKGRGENEDAEDKVDRLDSAEEVKAEDSLIGNVASAYNI